MLIGLFRESSRQNIKWDKMQIVEAPVTLLKAGPNSDRMSASGLVLTVDQPYNVISWSGRLLTSSLWTAVVLDVPTLAVLYGPRGLE